MGEVAQFFPSSIIPCELQFLLNCLLDQMSDRPQGNGVESEKKSRVHDEQRSLHLSLKPEITKLCEVLLLPVCSFFFFFYLLLVVLL